MQSLSSVSESGNLESALLFSNPQLMTHFTVVECTKAYDLHMPTGEYLGHTNEGDMFISDLSLENWSVTMAKILAPELLEKRCWLMTDEHDEEHIKFAEGAHFDELSPGVWLRLPMTPTQHHFLDLSGQLLG